MDRRILLRNLFLLGAGAALPKAIFAGEEGSLAPVAGAAGSPIAGAAGSPISRVPGSVAPAVRPFHRWTLGRLELTVVSDGSIRMSPVQPSFAAGVPAAAVDSLLNSSYRPLDAVELGINVLAIRSGDKLVLIDTGCGAAFGSGSGWLTSSLADAGIHPADVTDVVLTHAHPDHIGGLLGPDSSLTFPHAQIHISDIEYKFWIQDAPDFSKSALNNTDTIRQVISSTHAALKVLRPRLQFFADGDQLWGFIRLQKAAGHTPGHTLVHIFSDGDELVHIADLLHSDALQFAHPDWAFYGDTDRELAAATRQQVLAALSAGRKKVFAYHLPWPGIGHARRKGDEYEWVVESHPIPG